MNRKFNAFEVKYGIYFTLESRRHCATIVHKYACESRIFGPCHSRLGMLMNPECSTDTIADSRSKSKSKSRPPQNHNKKNLNPYYTSHSEYKD